MMIVRIDKSNERADKKINKITYGPPHYLDRGSDMGNLNFVFDFVTFKIYAFFEWLVNWREEFFF